ncbi:MAG: glycine oxidase ThiO [Bythopirellula sp.]
MSSTSNNYDVLIVGGGVIGLSLAWELAQHQVKVCLVDRSQLGKEASWAGAGMIPPGPDRSQWEIATPIEQIEALSDQLHQRWHERLLEQTGIDNEYRRCGSLQLVLSPGDGAALKTRIARCRLLGIACDALDPITLADIEPVLAPRVERIAHAYHLPTEAQIRNPRHLQALVSACQLAGVELRPGVAVQEFVTAGSRLVGAVTSAGSIAAEHFCLTAGCWSAQLIPNLGLELPIRPIRGQIVLLQGPPGRLRRNINVGARYLVPRRDGRVLVGSTQEDVGFLKANTDSGVAELLQFAETISPEIANLPSETQWSGLRPASADGLPYLGRLPQIENGWIATGHFRAGLQLSPATAVVMRTLMLSQEPPIDASSLELTRMPPEPHHVATPS